MNRMRWIAVWFLSVGIIFANSQESNRQQIIHQFFMTYNKFHPPGYPIRSDPNLTSPGQETDVKFYFNPILVPSLSLKTMNFQVDYFIYASWKETRLSAETWKNVSDINGWEIDQDIAGKLWIPFIKYGNCIGCSTMVIDPSHLKNQKMIAFIKDNFITFNVAYRTLQDFTCAFTLANYPFDTQKCHVRFEMVEGIFNYHVNLKPQIMPSSAVSGISVPPEFHLLGFTLNNCDLPPVFVDALNAFDFQKFKGKNVCLVYNFYLRRSTMQHVLMSYVPSCLIVILSWISFWIDAEKAPARITLGLTSLLTLATQLNSIQTNIAWGGVIKAIDVWMFACLLMVFASLIEFFLVNFCNRRSKRIKVLMSPPSTAQTRDNNNTENSCFQRFLRGFVLFVPRKCCWIFWKRLFNSSSSTIDKMAAVIFPMIFFLFNVTYWGFYGWRITRDLHQDYESHYEH